MYRAVTVQHASAAIEHCYNDELTGVVDVLIKKHPQTAEHLFIKLKEGLRKNDLHGMGSTKRNNSRSSI